MSFIDYREQLFNPNYIVHIDRILEKSVTVCQFVKTLYFMDAGDIQRLSDECVRDLYRCVLDAIGAIGAIDMYKKNSLHESLAAIDILNNTSSIQKLERFLRFTDVVLCRLLE